MARTKIKLALIGANVKSSFSSSIHRFILDKWGYDCEYELISVKADEFPSVINRLIGDFDGFNVTIPYKREIMAYLDEMVGDAFEVGSVNTIVCDERKGYNTDGVGLSLALEKVGVELFNKRVLVLGAGGAGRSVAKLCKDKGAQVWAYRRNREKLKEFCSELGVNECQRLENAEFDIIVNATGVGSKVDLGVSPIGVKAFEKAEWAIELAYNPSETEFLRLAKSKGANTLNGLSMLFFQAYYADCLYLKKTPSKREMDEFYKEWTYEIFNH